MKRQSMKAGRCVLLLCFFGTAVAGLHDAISVNTWIEINPAYAPAPNGGRHFPQSWNQLAYDSIRGLVYDFDRWYDTTRGQTIYANAVISLDCSSDSARLVKISNWMAQATAAGGYQTVPMTENATDSTPVDPHPYGCFVYVPERDALYLTNGANTSAAVTGVSLNDTWRLDVTARKWHALNGPSPTHNGDLGFEDAMAYDAHHGKIVHSDHGIETWILDIASEQWSRVNPAVTPGNRTGHMMAYDAKRHLVMLFGGGPYPNPGHDLWAYDAAANTWTRKADAPVDAKSQGFVYCPRHDIFLAQIDSSTYVYNPATDAWSTPKITGNARPAFQTLAYDGRNDLLVAQGGDWQKARWWIMRYAPGSSRTEQPRVRTVNQCRAPRRALGAGAYGIDGRTVAIVPRRSAFNVDNCGVVVRRALP